MKISKGNFKTMQLVGAVAGGIVPTLLDKVMPSSVQSNITKGAIYGVVGALVSTFGKGDLLGGMGAGMLGVAGATIGSDLVKGSSTSGVGLLPGQHAIMGVGRPLPRITNGARGWSASQFQKNEVKKANVI